jgi:hypothetical protein
MSTSYYRFKKPITSVQIVTEGKHDKVTVWINHQNTGTLTVDAGTGKDILEMFDSGEQVLHCYAGAGGPCVIRNDINILNEEYVISEYGNVISVAEVLAGRKIMTE